MVCLSRPYQLNFFKSCLPQILLGPYLNTLIHFSPFENFLFHTSLFRTFLLHNFLLCTFPTPLSHTSRLHYFAYCHLLLLYFIPSCFTVLYFILSYFTTLFFWTSLFLTSLLPFSTTHTPYFVLNVPPITNFTVIYFTISCFTIPVSSISSFFFRITALFINNDYDNQKCLWMTLKKVRVPPLE